MPSYEWIFLIAKPKFTLVQGASGLGDVWTMSPAPSGIAEATFPVELPERAIGSTNAQLIFDPFMGSGTTAIAADRLGRNFYGCDISGTYVKLAQKRLAEDRLKRSQMEMELT